MLSIYDAVRNDQLKQMANLQKKNTVVNFVIDDITSCQLEDAYKHFIHTAVNST
jgi:predicted GNAT family acetyltransferase